jgi:hypothetical protein
MENSQGENLDLPIIDLHEWLVVQKESKKVLCKPHVIFIRCLDVLRHICLLRLLLRVLS